MSFALVLHFAVVLHLNCTALSQSESSNFFKYIINYLKIPIINPGLIFVQGLFFGGGAYFRRDLLLERFCISKWLGLDHKNCLKHHENRLKRLA